mgnify:CR=1 FL=1
MSKVNYAAIDIGSNAVRLLIKSINPEKSEQLLVYKRAPSKGSPASGRRSIYTR